MNMKVRMFKPNQLLYTVFCHLRWTHSMQLSMLYYMQYATLHSFSKFTSLPHAGLGLHTRYQPLRIFLSARRWNVKSDICEIIQDINAATKVWNGLPGQKTGALQFQQTILYVSGTHFLNPTFCLSFSSSQNGTSANSETQTPTKLIDHLLCWVFSFQWFKIPVWFVSIANESCCRTE